MGVNHRAVKAAAAEPMPEFIVLDSNVFIGDYWLRSSSFVLLREYLKKTSATLVVPQIVLEEVINHHREALDKVKTEIREVRRTLSRLLRSARGPSSELAEIIKTNKDDPYDKFLENEFEKMGTQVPDYKDIPHKDIVARDLRRVRPFQQSGKGYRDALLWETVLRNCIKKDVATVFVTQNTADFCDAKNCLHEHLKADIQKIGADETDFTLFKDLVQFTDSMVVPLLKARKEFITLIDNNKVEGLGLAAVCDENMDTIIEAINNSPETMISDPGEFDPSVDVVDIPSEFKITSASEISADRLLITFEFRPSVSFLYFMNRSDYACLSDEETSGIQIVDRNWNESVMQVESTCEIDLKCRLTFDTSEHAVESFEVEDVESAET